MTQKPLSLTKQKMVPLIDTSKTLPPTREVFNRPPRIVVAPPQEIVDIPKPPKRDPLPPQQSIIILIMPVAMVGVMASVYIFINHASTAQMTFLLPMVIFAIMGPVTNMTLTRQRRNAVRKRNIENEKRYKKFLTKIRKQLKEYVKQQRNAALLSDPAPSMLEEQIQERIRLWERRPEDPDFLNVRVGRGARPFSVTLKFPPVEVVDTLGPEVQSIQEMFAQVEDMPCGILLPKVKSLGITGRRQSVAALTRQMLCQIVTHHSPEDVRLLVIYPASQRKDWDWVRQLPHTAPLKGCTLERLTAVGEDEANELLNFMLEELSQRASKDEDGMVVGTNAQTTPLPHLVVLVHDYVEVRKHAALTHAFKLGEQLGVSVIYQVAQEQAIPSECRGVVRLDDDGGLSYAAIGVAGDTLEQVSTDFIDLETAMGISQGLSPLEIAHEEDDAADLPTNVRLLDLLDVPFADQLDPEKWWGNGAQPRFGRLRVPIGMGVDGPVWLDLNDNAHGPHGIIAGTTGAGKSELLQSIIVGLAVTHHPHLVNFVLVDFKGGAAFKPFEKIPHTVGMVTDLSGKLTERALLALKSELQRREHILSRANAKKIAEYQAMHIQNPTTYEPLPNLLIIIDEFAELAKEHPSFMEGLVSVVQKGRSLGVHLILATQKPTGSVNANIWSNLKFRICLRVASLQDSRDMLGRSEAALLPIAVPGRAYFQVGSEIFEVFQSARISLPARVANPAIIAIKQSTSGAGEVIDQQVLMEDIEPYRDTLGAVLFKPWPPPLPRRISLQEVYRRVNAFMPEQSAASKQPAYGWLNSPMGMIDLPTEQRQIPWMLDMSHNGGHVLIAGASGTGKSVFLRTLITSLVRTHSPAQLHMYIIDFGGQSLRVFEKLPHIGGVFGETDYEYIRRLLRKMHGIIEERKQQYMTYQVEDFLAYQRRRLDDPGLPEMPAIAVLIDKFVEFRQIHEKEMEFIMSIARHGRTYGVYMVLTVDRPVAVPAQLMSLLEMRIALRLVETTDSAIMIGKGDAALIEPALAGRGYRRGKVLQEIQMALPVPGDDDDEQIRQLEEMVSAIAKGCKIPISQHAPTIKLLPEYVRADYFLMDAVSYKKHDAVAETILLLATTSSVDTQRSQQVLCIRLGIEDFSLRPIALELNADTPHVLIAGGPGSGKTAAIHTCMLMLAAPENRHARVILVDFRRSARVLRRLPNVWKYVDGEESLAEATEELKKELRARVIQLREELEQQQEDNEEMPGANLLPLVLVIDDYDQLGALMRNPLNDLKEFMLKARDLHFHVIIAGPPADIMRNDPILAQARIGRLGVVLGGDPADPPVLGMRLSDMPPGRASLVRRNQKYLIQIAHIAPATLPSWVGRLKLSQSEPELVAPL